eukprot:9777494-Lingulodinium_polyedra.AAC.1
MLECSRLPSYLPAGAGKLVDVVSRSLVLGAPGVLPRVLQERVQSSESRLPSASFIHRYELALDISL